MKSDIDKTASVEKVVLVELCKAAGLSPVTEINDLAKGMWSIAYSVTVSNKKYVVRTSRDDADFRKDKIITEELYTSGLPVPKIIATGEYKALQYAISEQCEGYTMIDKNSKEEDAVRLFNCLFRLKEIDVSDWKDWGFINDRKEGIHNSWEEVLLCFRNHKMDYTIEALIDEQLLQKNVVEKAVSKIHLLLPFCKTEKHLVHGDFGFDNALTDGSKITGIIDWAEARLGDFLYDVAYLIFNGSQIDYKKLWQQYVETKQIVIQSMQERLLCYQLIIGLNNLAIAAHLNRRDIYEEDMAKLLPLL